MREVIDFPIAELSSFRIKVKVKMGILNSINSLRCNKWLDQK